MMDRHRWLLPHSNIDWVPCAASCNSSRSAILRSHGRYAIQAVAPRARLKFRSERCRSSTLSLIWTNGSTCQTGRICRRQLLTWLHSVATQTCSNFFGNTMPTLWLWHRRVLAHCTWRLRETSRKVLISSFPEKIPQLWMKWINQVLRLLYGRLIAAVRLPSHFYLHSPMSK